MDCVYILLVVALLAFSGNAQQKAQGYLHESRALANYDNAARFFMLPKAGSGPGSKTYLTNAQVIDRLQNDDEFIMYFSNLIKNFNYQGKRSGLYFESKPIAQSTLDDPYQFVLISTKRFAGNRKQDNRSFLEYWTSNEEKYMGFNPDFTRKYPRTRNDGVMVSPRPEMTARGRVAGGQKTGYMHLQQYLNADLGNMREKTLSLWKTCGKELDAWIQGKAGQNAPTYFSTAGNGVAFLHIRIEDTPKYYKFTEYRNHRISKAQSDVKGNVRENFKGQGQRTKVQVKPGHDFNLGSGGNAGNNRKPNRRQQPKTSNRSKPKPNESKIRPSGSNNASTYNTDSTSDSPNEQVRGISSNYEKCVPVKPTVKVGLWDDVASVTKAVPQLSTNDAKRIQEEGLTKTYGQTGRFYMENCDICIYEVKSHSLIVNEICTAPESRRVDCSAPEDYPDEWNARKAGMKTRRRNEGQRNRYQRRYQRLTSQNVATTGHAGYYY